MSSNGKYLLRTSFRTYTNKQADHRENAKDNITLKNTVNLKQYSKKYREERIHTNDPKRKPRIGASLINLGRRLLTSHAHQKPSVQSPHIPEYHTRAV